MDNSQETFGEDISIESTEASFRLLSIAENIEKLEINKYLYDKSFINEKFLTIQQLTIRVTLVLKNFENQIGFTKLQKTEGLITSLSQEEKEALSVIISVLKKQIVPFLNQQ